MGGEILPRDYFRIVVPVVKHFPEWARAYGDFSRFRSETSAYLWAVAECIDCMPDLEAYDVNRKLLYHGLTEIGYECVKPDGAFYLFVKTPGGDNSVFCEKAKARNLLVVPSEPFGVEGYFRLGYCVSKEMIERALPVFREVFEEMR